MNFKVGDKVKYSDSLVGKIGCIEGNMAYMSECMNESTGIVFKYPEGSYCEKHRTFMGYSLENLSLLESAKPQKTAIYCPTKKDFHDVQTKMFEEGNRWSSGKKEHQDNYWDTYEEEICIDFDMKYSPKNFYKEAGYKIIEASEYLGTREPNEYKSIYSCLFTNPEPSLCEPSEQNKLTNKTMITTKLFKSKENKALEHFNLGTTCELNSNGLNEFLAYLYETNQEARKGFLAKMVEAHKEEK